MDRPVFTDTSVKDRRAAKTKRLTRNDLTGFLISVAGFFLGRAVLFQLVNPLGAAFAVLFLGTGQLYVTVIFVAAGALTKLHGVYAFPYAAGLALLLPVNWALRRFVKTPLPVWLRGVCGAAALLAAGTVSFFVNGRDGFLLLLSLLEGGLTMLLAFLMKNAVAVISDGAPAGGRQSLAGRRIRHKIGPSYALTAEELIGLALLAAGLISGAADIAIAGVSLRLFLCCLLVLFLSDRASTAPGSGAAIGAVAGLLLGALLYMGGYCGYALALVLGVAGLAGGLVRPLGRFAVLGAFGVMGAAAAYFTDPTQLGFAALYSYLFAGMVFLLLPARFRLGLEGFRPAVREDGATAIDERQALTAAKLAAYAAAFRKLGNSFAVKRARDVDLTGEVERLAGQICADCPRHGRCWDADYYVTKQALETLLDKAGPVDGAELRDTLGAGWRCEHSERLLARVNEMAAARLTGARWRDKLQESRAVTGRLFHGLAAILSGLGAEMGDSAVCGGEWEEAVVAALSASKAEVRSLAVLTDSQDRLEIVLRRQACDDRAGCHDLLPVLERAVRRPLTPEGCSFDGEGCVARYTEERRFFVSAGVAAKAAANAAGQETGDSYVCQALKTGRFMLALSDGMGMGRQARRESAAAVELVEDLLTAGFEKELAVRVINSALVLRHEDDSFATLDLCLVDLYTGRAELTKIGAASSFLLREGRVTALRSSSLPMGIVEEMEPETLTKDLLPNDLLVMVTDGMLDVRDNFRDKERWVCEALAACPSQNPQEIADYLLAEAVRLADGNPRDDMTVLAARIWVRESGRKRR